MDGRSRVQNPERGKSRRAKSCWAGRINGGHGAIKRWVSGILAFVLTASVVFSWPMPFSDAYAALATESNAGREQGGSRWATASNAKYRDGKAQDVDIYIIADDNEVMPGNETQLTLYLKNNTDEPVTDGELRFSGRYIKDEDGYFTDMTVETSENEEMSAGETISADEETLEGDGEAFGGNEEDFDEAEEEEEPDRLEGIDLEPGELYEVIFTFYTDADLDEMKNTFVEFRFTGEQDAGKVHSSEKFYYGIGMPFVEMAFAEGEQIESGVLNEMNIWLREPAWYLDDWDQEDEDLASASEARVLARGESIADLASDSDADLASGSDAGKTENTGNAQTGEGQHEEILQEAMAIEESRVSYQVEVYGTSFRKFRPKKNTEAEDIGWISCLYEVSRYAQPGIYYGKVTAKGKWHRKSFTTSQGFFFEVTGEGTISLAGELNGMVIEAEGPASSFPEAEDLYIAVSEIDQEKKAMVDEALRKKAEEEGTAIEKYKAVDIKLYADGEETEPEGPIQVAFRNVELTERVELQQEEAPETADSEASAAANRAVPAAKTMAKAAPAALTAGEDGDSGQVQAGDASIKVFHLDEEALAVNEMTSTVPDDGTVVMDTDHFSIYIVVNVPEVTEVTVNVEHWATLDKLILDNGIPRESEANNQLYPGAEHGSTYAKQHVKIYADDTGLTLPSGAGTGVGYSIAVSNWSKVALGGNYKVKSVTVTNTNYPNGETFTEDGTDQIIQLARTNDIKIEYEPTSGSIKGYAGFHDYNVSIESNTPDHGNLSTNQVGINNWGLPEGNDRNDRIGVGICDNGKNGQIHHGYQGRANEESGVREGIPADQMVGNQIKFNYPDPGLFVTSDIMTDETYLDGSTVKYYAKKYLPNYQLEFNRSGDTYTLSSVYDESGKQLENGLEKIQFTTKAWGSDKKLYSNLFWPLDGVNYDNAVYGKNRDPQFGNNYDFAPNDEGGSVTHNWFFGMRYDFEFSLGDYTGPLDYYFRGDDDFWLFIDGELVKEVDLGGIHSATGAYVDLRELLGERGTLDQEKHTMSVFFMERGGTGSCCYMRFTLPNVSSIPTPESETTKRTVTKVWEDNGNENGLRPNYIYVQLKQNGAAFGSPVCLDASNNWSYQWTNLPKYKNVNNNEEHVYTVEEVGDVPGYESSVNGMTITNTLLREISIEKKWDGNSGESSVQVQLFKKDGNTYTAYGNVQTLNSENGWKYTWKDLEVYDQGGKPIHYVPYEVDSNGNRIEEGTAIMNGKYIVNYSDDHGIVTNVYNYTTVSVTKIWEDYDNRYDTRPESIQVQLYQNDTVYRSPVTLDASGSWSYTWEKLPVKADGNSEPYQYTVKELDNSGNPLDEGESGILGTKAGGDAFTYTAEYSKAEKGEGDALIITNELKPAVLRLRKVVNADGEANEPIAAEYKFLIQLKDAEGKLYTTVALGHEEVSGDIFVVPPAKGESFTIEEIVPMEYQMTGMEVTGGRTDSLENDIVTVLPGDDITITLRNKADHSGYFHNTESVTNVKQFANETGEKFEPENYYEEPDGTNDLTKDFASDFHGVEIAALVDLNGNGFKEKRMEEGDDLLG